MELTEKTISDIEKLPERILLIFTQDITPQDFIYLSKTSSTLREKLTNIEDAAFRFYYQKKYDMMMPYGVDAKTYFFARSLTWLVYYQAYGRSMLTGYYMFASSSVDPNMTIKEFILHFCKEKNLDLEFFSSRTNEITIVKQNSTDSMTSIRHPQHLYPAYNYMDPDDRKKWFEQQKVIDKNQFKFSVEYVPSNKHSIITAQNPKLQFDEETLSIHVKRGLDPLQSVVKEEDFIYV